MNPRFINSYITSRKFLWITLKHAQTLLRRNHRSPFVIGCEQTRHPSYWLWKICASRKCLKYWVIIVHLRWLCTDIIFTLEGDPLPGRPQDAVTLENVSDIKNLITTDRWISYQQIQHILNINESSVHLILTNYIRVRKVSTLWVPHPLPNKGRRGCNVVQKNLK